MALPRFFMTGPLPATEAEPVPLAPDDLRHIANALRLREGERLALVDPAGRTHIVEVVSVSGRELRARHVGAVERPWEPHVVLVAGIAKGDKVDQEIQGAVEVGVEAVWPVQFSRDVVRLNPTKRSARAERWRRVAHAAAKQAGRFAIPKVAEIRKLEEVLPVLGEADLVLVAWEDARSGAIRESIRASGVTAEAKVVVVVGSEGGLTQAEVDSLESAGGRLVTLGPTILRAETAGVVAAALVVSELRFLHATGTVLRGEAARP